MKKESERQKKDKQNKKRKEQPLSHVWSGRAPILAEECITIYLGDRKRETHTRHYPGQKARALGVAVPRGSPIRVIAPTTPTAATTMPTVVAATSSPEASSTPSSASVTGHVCPLGGDL